VNAVSVSFFFPGVPYEDVATPHARGRVERFVGREIKRAVVAAVAEASIRIAEADVEVVGMSRGPPPAVAAATAADAASREVAKGTRFGNEDTTDDRLDHGFASSNELELNAPPVTTRRTTPERAERALWRCTARFASRTKL